MKFSYLYLFSCLLLFIGLFWMLLPHALHKEIVHGGEEESHLWHMFQGFLIFLVGLTILFISNKPKKISK